MEKQTNILTTPQNLTPQDHILQDTVSRDGIPVNTRTIGAPEGIYILYIEDYVHTFIRKILSDSTQNERSDEKIQQRNIALYGRMIEESGRYRIVIPGAAVCDGGSERIQQLNNTYFPSCSYIGNAVVSFNKDSRLRLELTLRSTKVILDDFYIYYDQNEEMQNYLVEWNTTRENDKSRIVLSPTQRSTNDAAHLGRITQAYNREEAKVSFMWNIMNVLCLGFVVCVMAYGIISMNNYHKMQSMQEKIDYCMAFVEENTSFLLGNTQTEAVMQQNIQVEGETAKRDESQEHEQIFETMPTENSSGADADQSTQGQATLQGSEQSGEVQEIMQDSGQSGGISATVQNTEQSGVTSTTVQNAEQFETTAQGSDHPEEISETIQDAAQAETAPEMTQALAQAAIVTDDTQASTDQTAQPAQGQPSTPQYYVVRRGDTLRTICYSIYGDYSRVDEVCRWNNIDNPDNILYGQKLLLP